MKVAEVKAKAEELGIDTKKMKKTELVLAIQAAEGNEQCYGTNTGSCPYTNCCFWDDCLKESKKA